MERVNYAHINQLRCVSDEKSKCLLMRLYQIMNHLVVMVPAAPGTMLDKSSNPERNPYGVDVNGYFRWTDIGTRDNVVNDTMVDVNVGVNMDLANDMA